MDDKYIATRLAAHIKTSQYDMLTGTAAHIQDMINLNSMNVGRFLLLASAVGCSMNTYGLLVERIGRTDNFCCAYIYKVTLK